MIDIGSAIQLGNAINRQHPLNRGLTAHWMCAPSLVGGNQFRDLCWQFNGTLGGLDATRPKWNGSRAKPGGFGAALKFDGTDDFVSIPATRLSCNGEITVSAWINLASVAAGAKEVFAAAQTGSLHRFGCEVNRTGGRLSLLWGNTVILTSSTTMLVDKWYHATYVRSGAAGAWTGTIYLNGIQDGTAATATDPNGTLTVTLGRLGGSAALYFNGLMDDVRLYDGAAKNARDVFALYSESRKGYPSVLNRLSSIRRWMNSQAAPGGNRRRRVLLTGTS